MNRKCKTNNTRKSSCVAIKEHNSIWSWGFGKFGQLGTEETKDITIPKSANYLMK